MSSRPESILDKVPSNFLLHDREGECLELLHQADPEKYSVSNRGAGSTEEVLRDLEWTALHESTDLWVPSFAINLRRAAQIAGDCPFSDLIRALHGSDAVESRSIVAPAWLNPGDARRSPPLGAARGLEEDDADWTDSTDSATSSRFRLAHQQDPEAPAADVPESTSAPGSGVGQDGLGSDGGLASSPADDNPPSDEGRSQGENPHAPVSAQTRPHVASDDAEFVDAESGKLETADMSREGSPEEVTDQVGSEAPGSDEGASGGLQAQNSGELGQSTGANGLHPTTHQDDPTHQLHHTHHSHHTHDGSPDASAYHSPAELAIHPERRESPLRDAVSAHPGSLLHPIPSGATLSGPLEDAETRMVDSGVVSGSAAAGASAGAGTHGAKRRWNRSRRMSAGRRGPQHTLVDFRELEMPTIGKRPSHRRPTDGGSIAESQFSAAALRTQQMCLLVALTSSEGGVCDDGALSGVCGITASSIPGGPLGSMSVRRLAPRVEPGFAVACKHTWGDEPVIPHDLDDFSASLVSCGLLPLEPPATLSPERPVLSPFLQPPNAALTPDMSVQDRPTALSYLAPVPAQARVVPVGAPLDPDRTTDRGKGVVVAMPVDGLVGTDWRLSGSSGNGLGGKSSGANVSALAAAVVLRRKAAACFTDLAVLIGVLDPEMQTTSQYVLVVVHSGQQHSDAPGSRLPTSLKSAQILTCGDAEAPDVYLQLDRRIPAVAYLMLLVACVASCLTGKCLEKQYDISPIARAMWFCNATAIPAFLLCVGAILYHFPSCRMTKADWGLSLAGGICLALWVAGLSWGLEETSHFHAFSLSHIHLLLLAACVAFPGGADWGIVAGSSPYVQGWFALLGVVGTAAAFLDNEHLQEKTTWIGDLAAAAGGLFGGLFLLTSRALWRRGTCHPLIYFFIVQVVAAGVCCLGSYYLDDVPVSFTQILDPPASGFFGWMRPEHFRLLPDELYLAVVCGVFGLGGYITCLKYYSPLAISGVMVLEPYLAEALGIVLRRAEDDWWTLGGACAAVITAFVMLLTSASSTQLIDVNLALNRPQPPAASINRFPR